jgi:hypothetical protein
MGCEATENYGEMAQEAFAQRGQPPVPNVGNISRGMSIGFAVRRAAALC